MVTFNLKDFPLASVTPFEVEVVHPDDFLLGLTRAGVPKLADAVREAL